MNKIVIIIISVVAIYFIYNKFNKANFNDTLSGGMLTDEQPLNFPPVAQEVKVQDFPDLVPPVVPEEIGLAMVYPQGQGVGMSKSDSNSFQPGNPGDLLTDYTIPESYGESSLTDPLGNRGSDQAARVLKIGSTGSQLNFKPTLESDNRFYSSAYTDGLVDKGTEFFDM